jgi:hypothetical protein
MSELIINKAPYRILSINGFDSPHANNELFITLSSGTSEHYFHYSINLSLQDVKDLVLFLNKEIETEEKSLY